MNCLIRPFANHKTERTEPRSCTIWQGMTALISLFSVRDSISQIRPNSKLIHPTLSLFYPKKKRNIIYLLTLKSTQSTDFNENDPIISKWYPIITQWYPNISKWYPSILKRYPIPNDLRKILDLFQTFPWNSVIMTVNPRNMSAS